MSSQHQPDEASPDPDVATRDPREPASSPPASAANAPAASSAAISAGPPTDHHIPGVPFREAFRAWLRVAVLSFGGPAGQIAVMHRIVVDEKKWVSEERFLHALNYCMLLPGPEAQQLATYLGWLLHRTWGGLVAGTLFILPGFLSILALSLLYVTARDLTFVEGFFFGLKAAVLAIVIQAVVKIGSKALRGPFMMGLAVTSFIAIFALQVPFPLIIFGAGIIGLIVARVQPHWLHRAATPPPPEIPTDPDVDARTTGNEHAADRDPTWRGAMWHSVKVLAIWLPIWLIPIGVLAAIFGSDHVLVDEALFFSKAALVTFGGAYSVLAYVAQQAVDVFGWLQPGEMLDGLGMAETTPGPLIQVVQFVGFMGAFRHPAPFDSPLLAGVVGSIVTTWVTFAPCFLWIFLGAPYIERLRRNRILSAALATITAAVVGVVLNLAVWFAVHVMFAEVGTARIGPVAVPWPDAASVQWAAIAISGFALLATFALRWGMLRVLLICAAAGAGWSLVAGPPSPDAVGVAWSIDR